MHRLHDMERAVMPGFYGGGADGRIHTLPRGGLGYLRSTAGKRLRVGCLRKLDGRARHFPRRSCDRAQRKGDSRHGL